MRAWGRSLGIVIPKNMVSSEKLKEGDTVALLLVKKTNALKKTFGTRQFKKSTDEILKEIDEEGWHD